MLKLGPPQGFAGRAGGEQKLTSLRAEMLPSGALGAGAERYGLRARAILVL